MVPETAIMVLPVSPSADFPSIVGSPAGVPAPRESTPVLSGTMNWEPVRQRLVGSDLKDALEAATELREGIEIVHTVEFPLMLSALLPAFSTILAQRTKPSPDTSTLEHKLRNVVLEIISRMPSNEILRPHAPHLVAVALDILNRDYEENAMLASRIIFDLYKVYRTLPQDYIQPYLDFVKNSYRALPASVQRNFSFAALVVSTPGEKSKTAGASESVTDQDGNHDQLEKHDSVQQPNTPEPATAKEIDAATPPAPESTSASQSMPRIPSTPTPRLSPPSNASFRVMTECPLIVMLMFQLYPKFLRGNIAGLISVMMEALALRAPSMQSIVQDNQPLEASANRLYFSRCRELVAAQAKTLSFLTYLLRGFSNDLKPYEDRLATNVVALMTTCPREFISTRKELLVATRHLLNSEFRNGFFRHVNALLDERVLMGSHHRYSEQAVLRPLGYTTLSDLVHHVRNQLGLDQISKVVTIFSRVLHDSSMILPMSTQYTAVRTLLSVVDIVFNNKDRDPQIGRDILVRISKTLVDKLDSLFACRNIARQKGEKRGGIIEEKKNETEALAIIEHLELPLGCDIKESLRDLKSMIRAIIVGHKTLIAHISKYRGQREKEKAPALKTGTNEEVSSAMMKITHTEEALIDRYLTLAFPCMSWLKEETSSENSGGDQYRDALSYFAAAFTVLDGYDLRRTLGRRLEEMVDAVAEDSAALVVPRHLLAANATTSFEFCTLLLAFLASRMDCLTISVDDTIRFLPPSAQDELRDFDRVKAWKPDDLRKEERKKRSVAHLQLFERVLKSLSTFPENERALRPHLKFIVSTCLRTCLEVVDFTVDNHCMLLRYVFRSISAGKFEESYKELLPLIPTVLNGLFRVFRATDSLSLQHTIVELLLTIPARLSSLLPHMNLLLRVIIAALDSELGDLVNLGLRTLEFWIDNLNPEFLFPEITKQKDLFVSLMKALSVHLRPAPYPYGLLTLRLLGKLGGKNRRALREPMAIVDAAALERSEDDLRLRATWVESTDPGNNSSGMATDTPEFSLPLSIDRSIELVKKLVSITDNKGTEDVPNGPDVLRWGDCEQLLSVKIEETNFLPYCNDVMKSTQKSQAEAAVRLLRHVMSEMIAVDSSSIGSYGEFEIAQGGSAESKEYDIQAISASRKKFDNDLRRVTHGLLLSCCIGGEIGDDSLQFAKGLVANVFLIVIGHQSCFVRIDANGSDILEADTSKEASSDIFEDVVGSLKPFGYFEQRGVLENSTNPLVVNSSLADMLLDPSSRVQMVGLQLLEYLLNLPESVGIKEWSPDKPERVDRGCLIFFENLVAVLCEKCIVSKWGQRRGIYRAMCLVLSKLGRVWSRKYEVEIMNAVLFSLKSVPREMSMASMKTFEFIVHVCEGLYGSVRSPKEDVVVDELISKVSSNEDVADIDKEVAVHDEGKAGDGTSNPETPSQITLTSPSGPDSSEEVQEKAPTAASPEPLPANAEERKEVETGFTFPCCEVVQLLINEVASMNHLMRFTSRYILKNFVISVGMPEKSHELLNEHMALFRKVLFSRSLRLLPLPEQIGAVEALAMVVDQVPGLIPLNDQHLLAFLSELLKMSSVADGAMTDQNLIGSVVDKNGYAVPVRDTMQGTTGRDTDQKNEEFSPTSVFLRRDSIVLCGSTKFFVPGEASNGVQLRASAIRLLRAVIRGHADPFFDAESATPVGNIRPHVISLLFRSLISFPLECVNASHDALRDVLNLSVVTKNGKSQSRLRKELLQTCIRPVLLNLRDYSRLSVHLLRGLSRLLALLSSWFNKTLGEKLLDHLQKWTDPHEIRSQHIWREGTEPEVAAAIIDLFVLLPHAAHFVEPLVKTTIKLEACLPVFQANYTLSPYRKPLARYLNKHCQYTVSFFLQRLKTPLYNEMFQDILAFPESSALRLFMTGKQVSVSLLNVCFERPLAIIRSEKTAADVSPQGTATQKSSPGTDELFHLHGIHPFTVSPTQKEIALKQDLDAKRKKLTSLQQELNRSKEAVSSKSSSAVPTEVEETKRKHRMAKVAFDRGSKEFNESRQRYAAEVARIKASQKPPAKEQQGDARPMTIEALELQHQGFRLISTLFADDDAYFEEHSDVLRAFRWLWRSKGRNLRLHHEYAVPPRYHDESKLLAKLLVDYSESNPNDVDLLFELIRIFLQPSSCDFAFVRTTLANAATNLSSSQKAQIMQRFFALLSGESSEEIKTLSIQLVVYPMLQASFRAQTKPEFIPSEMPGRFVTDVLFHKGTQLACGERLKVELLKMANIFLEYVPESLEKHGDDIVKFCLSLVKSEDTLCKSWAYLVLCRQISTMGTDAKLILQVYRALTRMHQPEGKTIVKAGLDLLIPSLEQRLCDSDKKKAIEFTNQVMFEEVNSIPQLAHIWLTVISHPSTFYRNRSQFVRYMINSLTRLGLPPNAPAENRGLAVSVVELVLAWHRQQSESVSNDHAVAKSVDTNSTKRGNSESVGSEGHIDKKIKTAAGTAATPEKNLMLKDLKLLDQNMVDSLINFVLRLKILLGDSKLDVAAAPISTRVDALLKTIASEWKQCHIRTIYLDKIVAMCQEYNAAQGVPNEQATATKAPQKSKASSKSKPSSTSQSAAAKIDEGKQLNISILSACLDIFATLAEVAPSNLFLTDNSPQLNEILSASFHFARTTTEGTATIRAKLKKFILCMHTAGGGLSRIDEKIVQNINSFMERALISSERDCRNLRSSSEAGQEAGRHGRSRSVSVDDAVTDEGPALFVLEILREVGKKDKANFKPFTSSLLALLITAIKRHTTAASTKQKQGGVSFTPQGGTGTSTIPPMYHTPTAGILAESANHTLGPPTRVSKDPSPLSNLQDFDWPLRASVLILEIFGDSDIVLSFTSSRKIFIQILNSILESSNNVQLLLTSTRIVGRFLLDASGGPLTSKERSSFLCKLASLDYNGLPDTVGQTLSDLLALYFVSIFERKVSTDSPLASGKETIFGLLGDSDSALARRSLTACLLSSNVTMRDKVASFDLSQTNKDVHKENAATLRCDPADTLWQVLHYDFEGLGGRNWLVVFVEMLLSCSATGSTNRNRNQGSTRRLLPAPVTLSGRENLQDIMHGFTSVVEIDFFASHIGKIRKDFDAGGRALLNSLSLLSHADMEYTRVLFLAMFPKAWEAAPNDDVRFEMISSIETLLSRNFHSQSLKNSTSGGLIRPWNTVKVFLEGISLLSPMPVIDVDLMVSLAESYNCWYEAFYILEEQLSVLVTKPLEKAGLALQDKIMLALRCCYDHLGETGIATSLALRTCSLPETHRAASFAIHGEIDRALESYSSLVNMLEANKELALSDSEMSFVEEGWVRLQREQCQTLLVSEYAHSAKNPRLLLESAWKLKEWERVRTLCSSPSLVAAVEGGEASVKMCETLLAVANGKLGDVENLHAQTAQLCLYKWQLLPNFSHASFAHASLLHFFHRLVEIRESGQIMVETSNHSNGRTLPDLKNLLNAWRHRLPNDFEELATWDEIFTWRSHMFHAITSNFSWSEPSALATLHDRPWSCIRMAMTARKQNMRQTSLFLLNTMTDASSMGVSDAYLKLREQILAYNNPDSEIERTGGLNLINTSNLSYFDASQMSELFRLKAIFLSSLRRTSKSNQAYCHSVQISPSNSKAWVSWGGLCSSLGTLTEKSAEQATAKSGGTPEAVKDGRAAAAKKVSQYLAQAMGCYLEAVQTEASEKARIHLPKCLWMLTKDVSPSPGLLCQTLESRGSKLPPWVWLPWIPQLLTGLCRTEGRAIKSILSRVVKAYPQAVYYSLRAFYLERRDVERAKGESTTSSQHMASVAYAEEMMSTLRRSHASLWSSLEAILEELIVKFRPSYEEELLATISALLERAESHAEKQSLPDKTRVEDEEAMVSSWSKTLSRIAAKFFRPTETASATSRRDERVKKTTEFKRKFKTDFEEDFKVSPSDLEEGSASSNTKPQFKLSEYIERLQKWKTKLEIHVACTPQSIPLVECSHTLAMFAAECPDLWPGACDTKYVTVADHATHQAEDDRPQSNTSSSAAIAQKAAVNAALLAASAAAREGVGGDYGGGSSAIEIPGQYCPNCATTADVKPFPELHAKLRRFEPYVEVLRRNGQLVRRVSLLGSDGNVYRFLLQFAIPYWTRTDERTAQTNFVIDKFLRQNTITARNHLSVQPSVAIPVAQRLRITLDVESRVALDDILRTGLDTSGGNLESIPEFFLKEVESKMAAQASQELTQSQRETQEKAIRHDVYRTICSSQVGSRLFLEYVLKRFQAAENFYQFRRAFAGQLASNSLFQYIFSVAERTPSRFVLIMNKAIMLSPDFRISYSAQGFIEGLEIPFRMTPNIEALIGKPYLEGRFIRSIAMVAGAIREHREELDPILRLLMRDDILAWYSKSMAKSDAKTQELERQLIERVSKNVSLLHARFSECAPTSTKAAKVGAIDSRIKELYDQATNTEKLSMMPTNYHAWL